MNKTYLKKNVGRHVRLRPVPLGAHGQPIDGDWVIRSVDDSGIRLDLLDGSHSVLLRADHIYSFLSNPDRDTADQKYGFLQLLVQLTVLADGIRTEPIPPPKTPGVDALAQSSRFAPLIMDSGGERRSFSWRGRDPLHLIEREESPRQLLDFSSRLCEALRRDSGLEPQFNLPSSIRGEIVYELSPDFRARWSLLGGMGDGPGDQVLVLVPRR